MQSFFNNAPQSYKTNALLMFARRPALTAITVYESDCSSGARGVDAALEPVAAMLARGSGFCLL